MTNMPCRQPSIGTKKTVEQTSLDVVQLGLANPADHHAAAILPIAEAGAFP
jgi:hypothetical protein